MCRHSELIDRLVAELAAADQRIAELEDRQRRLDPVVQGYEAEAATQLALAAECDAIDAAASER